MFRDKPNPWIHATHNGKTVKGWMADSVKPKCLTFPLADGTEVNVDLKDVINSLKISKYI